MSEIHPTELLDMVFKSRAVVLDMLRRRGYDTTEYDEYSVEAMEERVRDSTDLSALDMRCPLVDGVEDRLPFAVVKYRLDRLKTKLNTLFVPPVDTTGIMADFGGVALDGTATGGGGGEDDDAATVVTIAASTRGGARGSRRKASAARTILDGFNRETEELILITGEHIGEASPFHKAVVDAYTKYNTKVSIFFIRDLIVNRLEHVLVPPHIRIPRSQHEALLKRLMVTSKSKLAIIQHHKDIIGRMLGLYPGDIVEIQRPSKTAGIHVSYRHC